MLTLSRWRRRKQQFFAAPAAPACRVCRVVARQQRNPPALLKLAYSRCLPGALNIDMRRHILRLLTVTLLAGSCSFVAAEDLYAQAARLLEARALEQFPDATVKAHIHREALDPRLQRKVCSTPTLTPRGQNVGGRVHLLVHCSGAAPWKFYLTANVELEAPVLVTAKTLARGAPISAMDVRIERRPVASVRGEPIRALDADIALAARRPLSPGTVLTTVLVERVPAVSRGDAVTIIATAGAVMIRTQGEALQKGYIGEQVRVKNRRSGRMIDAWVHGKAVVGTTPPPTAAPPATVFAKQG